MPQLPGNSASDGAEYWLPRAAREAMRPSLQFLRQLVEGQPAREAEVSEPLAILDRALAGAPFTLTDYTGILKAAQKTWKMGGHISRSWAQWKIAFPEETKLILELRFGFKWLWLPEVERFAVREMLCPEDYETYTPRRIYGEEAESLEQFIKEGLDMGYLLVAPPSAPQQHRLRIFSVPKPESTERRWVMNFKSLNHFLAKIPMKMTGVKALSQRIQQGMWLCAIDLHKFYWSFLVHRDFWNLQRISNSTGTQDFMMPVVGMGHRQAAQQTTRPARVISRKLEGWGIPNLNYLDEFTNWSQDKETAYIGMLVLVTTLHLLGVPISFSKLIWMPAQVLQFLGLLWDTVWMRRVLTAARRQKIQATAEELYQAMINGDKVQISTKAALLGQGISGREGAELLALYCTPLRHNLRDDLRRCNQDYNAWVGVPLNLTDTLTYLRLPLPLADAYTPIRKAVPTFTASADASCYAWGGESINLTPKMITKGEFSQALQLLHHNVLEWYAMEWTVTALIAWCNRHAHLRAQLQSARHPPTPSQLAVWKPPRPVGILVESDNMMVVALVGRAMTSSLPTSKAAIKFQRTLRAAGFELTSTHISGDKMVKHRLGDDLSRAKTRHWEWQMIPAKVLEVWRQWRINGLHVVDLFSTESTKQAKRFVSFRFQARALWSDAFSRPWSHELNSLLLPTTILWAFPPPRLLPQVMSHLQDPQSGRNIKMMLVTPDTTGGWWVDECRRHGWLQGEPIPLGRWSQLVIPPEGWKDNHGRGPPAWPLLVMRLLIRCAETAV